MKILVIVFSRVGIYFWLPHYIMKIYVENFGNFLKNFSNFHEHMLSACISTQVFSRLCFFRIMAAVPVRRKCPRSPQEGVTLSAYEKHVAESATRAVPMGVVKSRGVQVKAR